MERGDFHTGFRWGKAEGKNQLEDIAVDGRIILKWILKKWDWLHVLNWWGLG
jgi:hypothetical protein